MANDITQTQKDLSEQPKNASLYNFIPQSRVEVNVKLVREVQDYDFPQAKIAWQALEEAGINPGNIIANALNQGHNYPIEELTIQNQVLSPESDLLGETKISEDALLEYKYINQTSQKTALLEGSAEKNALVPINSELIITEESNTPGQKSIQMTAIIRNNPAQIGTNINILPPGFNKLDELIFKK